MPRRVMSLWRSRWALPIVAFLTFLVRALAWPWARIGGDEAYYFEMAKKVAHLTALPALGPEVSGSAARLPGPGLYLVGAPPFTLFDSLWAGAVYVALLHTLGAYMVGRLAAKARGERAGVVAAIVVALAPWDVLYGDRYWPSNLTPIIATLALYLTATASQRPNRLGGAAALAVFLPQLHLSVPSLWVAMGVVFVLRPPPKFPWRAVSVGVLLGALSYLPYLSYEVPHDFANTKLLFQNAQGKVAPGEAWTLPVKVLLTAVLYGSAEISYHLQRGYWAWAGGFDEVQAYLSAAGWQANLQRSGPWLLGGVVVSLLLSLAGWLSGLYGAVVALLRRLRGQPVGLDSALVLGLFFGFGAAAALLYLGKKPFFPHYANVLLPSALLPVALLLDGCLDRRWARPLGLGAAVISAAAGGVGLYRNYTTVDGLNGLGPITQMVERMGKEPGPVQLRFTHFPNEYAFQHIAQAELGRPLALSGNAKVRYTVHNDRPHQGELPPGGTQHGPVLLVRSPPTGDGGPPPSPVIQGWSRVKVEARCGDQVTPCRPDQGRCLYGEEPWHHFGPEPLPIGGAEVVVLFLHPKKGCTISAEIPADLLQGNLHFALTDPALAINAQEMLQVTLRRGAATSSTSTKNTPGFATMALPFGDGPVILELTGATDGARVFGFDIHP